MENLANEPKRLIKHYADLAIEQSETFQEAINLVREYSALSVLGQELKKAIQDEITKRALDKNVY